MRWSEAERRAMAEELVRETHANNGLAPVDTEQFWRDQEVGFADPFGADIPQCPIGTLATHECVFAELGIPEDFYKLVHDPEWRLDKGRRYNDKAEQIVGKRVLPETPPDPDDNPPECAGLHDIFEGENLWQHGSYWLKQAADDEAELEALLDRVEKRLENLREFMLPPDWEEKKQRQLAAGKKMPLYRGQRGPVTFAASIFGPENLIFLIHDNPDLAGRYRDAIKNVMLERARILDAEAGYTPETAPHGWGWADDNCCLLTAEMYDFFALPIIKAMFDRYSPDPDDRRFQHSDSDMGHIVPCLAKVDLNQTNFGPNVMVDYIRRHLPRAEIFGELAPFTYSRNDEVGIVEQFLRDFDMARERRGLLFATAGSVNNGSRLTGLRLIMAAIQRWGRYQ